MVSLVYSNAYMRLLSLAPEWHHFWNLSQKEILSAHSERTFLAWLMQDCIAWWPCAGIVCEKSTLLAFFLFSRLKEVLAALGSSRRNL